MPWKARNRVEYWILEKFSEKLEENDDISPAVKDVIQESLKETTISQAFFVMSLQVGIAYVTHYELLEKPIKRLCIYPIIFML
ncbi:hypothetical protein AKJ53_01110 [candidate division MSBL1 archaeon SCGC-AAA382F02]|uniref:Uncharacterized protein n=1 Tax=candidate division MSBL1 archaeon SCGC-AAA382F02 TaxID=1698282 RepID=A0A133VIA5_9EURY|nr:hypothetical protein AKJ53_01110 [candidate division MSBL1 archaeon SCGC-AAA382F02]